MKEIKVAKHSKQWCKTRMTTSAIVSIISFCVTVLTTPIMVHFYDEYGFDALCERYLNLGATNRIGYRDKVYKIQQIYDKGYVVCYAPEEVLYTWGMTDKEIELMQEVEFT